MESDVGPISRCIHLGMKLANSVAVVNPVGTILAAIIKILSALASDTPLMAMRTEK